MRRLLATILALLLLAVFGQTALAYGRFGATDLMYVPASGTLAAGALGLEGSFIGSTAMLGLDFGLAANLEAGLSVMAEPGWQAASLRVKYHLLSEKKNGFGLAIGAEDIGSGLISPYIMAGKTIGQGFQGYLGFGGGQIGGIMFGLNKQVALAYGTDLFMEYDGYELNLGARVMVGRQLRLDLGLQDLEQVVIGMSYVTRF